MAAFANGLLAHALDFDDRDAFIHAGQNLKCWTNFAAIPKDG